jgi:hypothetical protein
MLLLLVIVQDDRLLVPCSPFLRFSHLMGETKNDEFRRSNNSHADLDDHAAF